MTFALFAFTLAQFEFLGDLEVMLGDSAGGALVVHTHAAGDAHEHGAHADEEHADHACDHCCHGASHLTGIAVSCGSTVPGLHLFAQAARLTEPASGASPPPVPPPIA